MTRKAAPTTAGPIQVQAVPLDRSAAAAYRALKEVEAQIKALQERRDGYVGKIKACLGEAEEGTYKGAKVVTWKTSLRSSLSATLVKEKDPALAQACTKVQYVRTFKLVDES